MDANKTDRIIRNDFLFALALILLSLFVIFMSLRMPRPEGWATAPGLFPLLIGVVLFGMAAGLLISTMLSCKAVNSSCLKIFSKEEKPSPKNKIFVVVSGILVYNLILIPTLHFTISTFIYLLLTLWYFWRGRVIKVIAISVIATIFFAFVFTRFFNVILP